MLNSIQVENILDIRAFQNNTPINNLSLRHVIIIYITTVDTL